MTKAKIADALRRAGRTFFQAAGAYAVLNPEHAATTKALGIGALGAGIAAVWRMLDPAEKPEPGAAAPEPPVDPFIPAPKPGTTAGRL